MTALAASDRFARFKGNELGDTVVKHDKLLCARFPWLARPTDGVNLIH